MEKELQDLTTLTQEPNRSRYARQGKDKGRKVVGLLCAHVPEEIVHAAGMLPWRVLGAQRASTPRADRYRPPHTCLYCNHVLEALLQGDFEFLDAVVATSWDQDLVRLWDVWHYLGQNSPHYILHLPLSETETHRRQFRKEVRRFFDFIQELSGRTIRAAELYESMALYDRFRRLLHRLYEFRKRERPPLSGAETLGLTTAALLMPKEVFLDRLEGIMPELEKRTTSLAQVRPRLLVTSDRLDDPALLALIEETGCLVAMDDLDTGSRYFWNLSCPAQTDSLDQLLDKLADCYHHQPADPGMMTWAQQVDQAAAWVREFNLQGVLELPLMYSRSRQMRGPYFRERLKAMDIPLASFERGYWLSSLGQLKTRVEAFVEMLGGGGQGGAA